MFYDLIDYLYDNAPEDRVDNYVEMMNLLEEIAYTEHEESLQDLLMTSDMYPTVDTLTSLDAVLEEAARNTLRMYGIITSSHENVSTIELKALLNSMYTLSDSSNNILLITLLEEDNSDYGALLDILSELSEIDTHRLSCIIDEVTPEMISRLKDSAYMSDLHKSRHGGRLINPRVDSFKYLSRATLAKEFFHIIRTSYNFEDSIFMMDSELRKLSDKDCAINITALYLGSRNTKDPDELIMKIINRLSYDLNKQVKLLQLCRKAMSESLEIEVADNV